jgi:hypothetical protein
LLLNTGLSAAAPRRTVLHMAMSADASSARRGEARGRWNCSRVYPDRLEFPCVLRVLIVHAAYCPSC